jgi:hypothetical protein
MSSIVFDATALIHFSRAGRLRELQVSSTEDEAILLANVSKESQFTDRYGCWLGASTTES